ncbi:hypothetical protein Lepto7375DRAFT_2003 [Leptolyngbya sp. PCC 7375]|nr:hypothetical protein Lepto7375DRAFT_2003 [Leptolyngbya sp. PCC 7375]
MATTRQKSLKWLTRQSPITAPSSQEKLQTRPFAPETHVRSISVEPTVSSSFHPQDRISNLAKTASDGITIAPTVQTKLDSLKPVTAPFLDQRTGQNQSITNTIGIGDNFAQTQQNFTWQQGDDHRLATTQPIQRTTESQTQQMLWQPMTITQRSGMIGAKSVHPKLEGTIQRGLTQMVTKSKPEQKNTEKNEQKTQQDTKQEIKQDEKENTNSDPYDQKLIDEFGEELVNEFNTTYGDDGSEESNYPDLKNEKKLSTTEEDLSELEQEVELEPDYHMDGQEEDEDLYDLLDSDIDNPDQKEKDIIEALERLKFDIDYETVSRDEWQKIYDANSKMLEDLDEDKIHEMLDLMDKITQVNNLLSEPLIDNDINEEDLVDELNDLEEEEEEEEEEKSSQLINESVDDDDIKQLKKLEQEIDPHQYNSFDFYEDLCNNLIEAGERLLHHETRLNEKVELYDKLLAQLGGYQIKKSKVSFKNRKRLKGVGSKVLTVAKYALPVTAAPIKILNQVKAGISLAKSIKHIFKLKKISTKTKNKTLKEVIDYTIKQKTKKCFHKGLTIGGLGVGNKVYKVSKAAYKKARGTKGKLREAQAKKLYELGQKGDKEALQTIKELVGGDKNMTETMKYGKDGWKIIMDKMKST